ncbi:MAG: hypothetical protein DI603_19570 [Roseateles depolymerans]|uniref:DUF2946 domain-containing protein n=1 Tax=Roseateles depolymerans TaxID=76731 RepID=A0A2W5D8K7_9BURK|nr:MAG: hypothetical protein DI603_19570 [Roseateles depolymerans]
MNARRLARGWLLWLALILPIAQAMAGVHAFSHLSERQGDGIAHLVHCDLCVAAAHLAGGAPPPAALPSLPEAARPVLPLPAAAQAALPAAPRVLPPARAPPDLA